MSFFKDLCDALFAPVEERYTPVETQVYDYSMPEPTPANPDILVPWDSQKSNYHNVRVLCDLAGLTYDEKNLLCSCVYQESEFLLDAKHPNIVNGKVTSTDWGICQINDYYHIGINKDFPSVEYVLNNPADVVNWMIGMYKHGLLKQWVSYSSGAYQQWLKPNSPMWDLK